MRKTQKKEGPVLYYLTFLSVSALSRAITIGRVEVPRYPVVGNGADLVCNYELEKTRNGQEEKLYSVKWYKDGAEFYRFVAARKKLF